MPTNRRDMTGRVVSLQSPEASDARVPGTVAERLHLVKELSEMLWARTRRPLPAYTRATMPVVITSLREQPRLDRD